MIRIHEEEADHLVDSVNEAVCQSNIFLTDTEHDMHNQDNRRTKDNRHTQDNKHMMPSSPVDHQVSTSSSPHEQPINPNQIVHMNLGSQELAITGDHGWALGPAQGPDVAAITAATKRSIKTLQDLTSEIT